MKKFLSLFFLSILSVLHFSFCQNLSKKNEDFPLSLLLGEPSVQFYFSFPGRDSPEGSKFFVRRKLVDFLNSAKYSIDGFVYSLNDLDTLLTLRNAKRKGVKLNIQGDKDQDYSEAEKLGIFVSPWKGSGLHHTKVWIADGRRAFLGTGNFSGHGLIRDHNVYWETDGRQGEGHRLLEYLEEKHTDGILFSGPQTYLFAPEAGKQIQDKMIQAIEKAKYRIRYLIYTHYDPILSYALVEASKRGILVEGIYNVPVNPEGKMLSKLLSPPSAIYKEGNEDVEYKNGVFRGGLLHHKTMIIDDDLVLVGSYNYTVSARDTNREIFTEFRGRSALLEFIGEWERVRANSSPYLEEEETEEATQYFVHNIRSQIPTYLLSRHKEGNLSFDSNSSGLAKEVDVSESILKNNSESWKESSERYQTIVLDPGDLGLFLVSDPVSMNGWSLVNRWDRCSFLFAESLETKKLHLWDGKSKPVVYESISKNDFDLSLLTKMRTGEFWIVLETDQGNFHLCSKRKNQEIPKWILYLMQKQILSGIPASYCREF